MHLSVSYITMYWMKFVNNNYVGGVHLAQQILENEKSMHVNACEPHDKLQ